jgi:hypothetical protein
MKSRSTIVFLALIIATGFLTWYFTKLYYIDINNDRIEDIVTQEVALLEKAKKYKPPCQKINASNGFIIENTDEFVIIWKLSKNNKKIEKFVVNDSFDSAYEENDNICK